MHGGTTDASYEEEMFDDGVLKDVYVGSDAASRRSNLEISYPVSNGWCEIGRTWDWCGTTRLRVWDATRRSVK